MQGESVITLEAHAYHVRSPASTAEHTSGTALPLPIDRPTVEASLLLWFLPPSRPFLLLKVGGTERPYILGVGHTVLHL